MKKSILTIVGLTLISSLAMAESMTCETLDQKVKIDVVASETEITSVAITGTDSAGADLLVSEVQRDGKSLKVTLIDLTNAKGIELSTEMKDLKISGTLTDMGAPGSASTVYEVTCKVK